jgi:hypothetical protein
VVKLIVPIMQFSLLPHAKYENSNVTNSINIDQTSCSATASEMVEKFPKNPNLIYNVTRIESIVFFFIKVSM